MKSKKRVSFEDTANQKEVAIVLKSEVTSNGGNLFTGFCFLSICPPLLGCWICIRLGQVPNVVFRRQLALRHTHSLTTNYGAKQFGI